MTQSIIVGLNEVGRNLALLLSVATDHRIILVDSGYVAKDEDPKTGYSTQDRGYLRTDAVAYAISDIVPKGLIKVMRIPQQVSQIRDLLTDLCTNGVETMVFFCAGSKDTRAHVYKFLSTNCMEFVACGFDATDTPVVRSSVEVSIEAVLELKDFGYYPRLKGELEGKGLTKVMSNAMLQRALRHDVSSSIPV